MELFKLLNAFSPDLMKEFLSLKDGPVRKWVDFFDKYKTLRIFARNYFSEKNNCIALKNY